jgi:hypothetical protein
MLGSIDSLLIAAAMAITGAPPGWRRRAVVGFAVLDFVGAWIGRPTLALFPVAALLVSLLLAGPVLYAARRRPMLYALLPVVCAVDNLLIGSEGGPSQVLSAAMDGVASGLLAWIGLAIGDAVTRRFERAAQ